MGELLGKLSSVVSIRKGRAGHCAPSWHISTPPTDERGTGDWGPWMFLVVESSQKHGGFGWVVLELLEPRAHAACTFLLLCCRRLGAGAQPMGGRVLIHR